MMAKTGHEMFMDLHDSFVDVATQREEALAEVDRLLKEQRRLKCLVLGLRRSISKYVGGADMHSPGYSRVLRWFDRHPELRDGPWSFYWLSKDDIVRWWGES